MDSLLTTNYRGYWLHQWCKGGTTSVRVTRADCSLVGVYRSHIAAKAAVTRDRKQQQK